MGLNASFFYNTLPQAVSEKATHLVFHWSTLLHTQHNDHCLTKQAILLVYY